MNLRVKLVGNSYSLHVSLGCDSSQGIDPPRPHRPAARVPASTAPGSPSPKRRRLVRRWEPKWRQRWRQWPHWSRSQDSPIFHWIDVGMLRLTAGDLPSTAPQGFSALSFPSSAGWPTEAVLGSMPTWNTRRRATRRRRSGEGNPTPTPVGRHRFSNHQELPLCL